MTPQPRTRESQDNRDDRLRMAQRTGEFRDEFTGGVCPMMLKHEFLVPDQDYLDAEQARRQQKMQGKYAHRRRQVAMTAREEIEHADERN